MSTPYQAKYFAAELSRRFASDRHETLAWTINKKSELQKETKRMERSRTQKRRELFDQQDKVDARRDESINELEGRLKQMVSHLRLFAIQWRLI